MTGFLKAHDLKHIVLGEQLAKDLQKLSPAERQRVMPFIEAGDDIGLIRELEKILAEVEAQIK